MTPVGIGAEPAGDGAPAPAPRRGGGEGFVARPEAELMRIADMATLERVVKGCTACRLRAGCRGVVFGDGNPAPSGPAPKLSAQTEAWLERLGYGGEDIQRLRDSGVI